MLEDTEKVVEDSSFFSSPAQKDFQGKHKTGAEEKYIHINRLPSARFYFPPKYRLRPETWRLCSHLYQHTPVHNT